jgi:hypothetical protein
MRQAIQQKYPIIEVFRKNGKGKESNGDGRLPARHQSVGPSGQKTMPAGLILALEV